MKSARRDGAVHPPDLRSLIAAALPIDPRQNRVRAAPKTPMISSWMRQKLTAPHIK
jgi:hypothetical protein